MSELTPTPTKGRNYDQTSTEKGLDMIYVQVKLSGNQSAKQFVHFQIGKDDTRITDQLTGYLENVLAPEWKPAVAKTNIPPHWEYKIIMSAKDDADGVVKPFCISLSAHWKNSLVSNFFNQLAGAMATDAWQDPDNRLVRFTVYLTKDTQVPKAYLYAGPRPAERLPNKYLWDDVAKTFTGTPDVPAGPNGKPDFSIVSDFWHNEACLLAEMFGNDTSKSKVAPGTGIQGTGNYAGATQTTATTAAVPPLVDRAFNWLVSKFEKGAKTAEALVAVTREGFALTKQQQGTEADLVALGQKVYAYGVSKKILNGLVSQKFDLAGNLVDNAPPAATDPFGVALPGNVDDLPF